MRLRLAALAISLSGCASVPTVVPAAPIPPRVDCQQGRTQDVPAWPVMWWQDGPAWAIQVLGIVEQERKLRAAEHDCIKRLKAQGAIR
jgi:uncharacterized protein YceK